MCSSATTTRPNFSLLFPKITHSVLRRRLIVTRFDVSRQPPRLRVAASLAGFSWVPSSPEDEYSGWGVVDYDTFHLHRKSKIEWRKIVIGGVGSSLAVLLASIAYFAISGKVFRLRFSSPWHSLPLALNRSENEKIKTLTSLTDVFETSQGRIDDASGSIASASAKRVERVIVPVALDTTQQEALAALKKLKIIEDDVRAQDLCTRREYARWVFRTNFLLERSPSRRITPAVALAGTSMLAFDDVNVEDQDFECIQAMAEAGIIHSKLSSKDLLFDKNISGSINFFPESFVSRLDLINWKAHVEYDFHPDIVEEISRTEVDFMDVKEINPNVAQGLFMDILAGDKGITRTVFGRIKRFQPNKPATKAQAAVALTSGRMVDAISAELSRIEAETFLRQAEMEEIRSELLEKGEIKQYWDEKLQEQKTLACEMQELYLATVRELEKEKIAQENWFAEHLKEKAAVDCQKQLLHSLREEVEQMSERLTSDKSACLADHSKLQVTLSDLQSKLETLLDKRSILEAEIEALRILRSWVEDEARASQARAKFLEEVGRRWKWDGTS